VPAWLAAGAYAVGIGTDLLSDDLPAQLRALRTATGGDPA
jgi:hypothetical protein